MGDGDKNYMNYFPLIHIIGNIHISKVVAFDPIALFVHLRFSLPLVSSHAVLGQIIFDNDVALVFDVGTIRLQHCQFSFFELYA